MGGPYLLPKYCCYSEFIHNMYSRRCALCFLQYATNYILVIYSERSFEPNQTRGIIYQDSLFCTGIVVTFLVVMDEDTIIRLVFFIS